MTPTKYLIGNVANLMGISRDTLRYYEKRGILSSEKTENGYRYYTDLEISRLAGILYQRKMNISLENLETLWAGENFIPDLMDMMENRLEEEKKTIRSHQQAIARLELTHSDCQRIQKHLGQVALQHFPSAYVIVPDAGMQESVGIWFRMTKEYPGLDMMYLFDEYELQTGPAPRITYQNTSLVLYEKLKELVDYEIPADAETTAPRPCIYSFCTSFTRQPGEAELLPMINWAKDHGLTLSDRLYSTYATQGLKDGQHTYYLELYIPLI